MSISRADRERLFGKPGKVDKVTVTTPWGPKVSIHRLIAAVFLQACRDAYETVSWRPQRIDSYNHRTIRGSASPSLHGYALAFDFFATPPNVPPPGGVWTPHNGVPVEFARCFTRRGFTWGAGWARKDVPHIEWGGGMPELAPHPPVAPPVPTEDLMADTHGTARILIRSFLGRNPNDQAELDLHAWALAVVGLNQRCVELAESPEGKAWEAKQRKAA